MTTTRDGPGPVERAARSELRSLKVSVQSDAKAALAVALAGQIDRSRGAVAAAAAATQLRLLLDDLRAAARDARPERTAVDNLIADELAARRSAG